MDTSGEIELIGNDKSLHLAQVPFCKGSGPNEVYSEPWSRMSTVGNVPLRMYAVRSDKNK